MKFAPMNYHYLRYPIKKFLDKVERSPFNSIDLYCSAPQLNLFDYPLSRLIELKKEIEAHHLSVMAMTPENCVYPVNFCTQDDLTRESSIRYYQRAIDTAQFLDCPCVQISTGFGYFDQPREEGWKYCRESLWTLAQYCEKKDVRLLLEELKVTTTNVLITSKDIAKMLEEIESPLIGTHDQELLIEFLSRAPRKVTVEQLTRRRKELGNTYENGNIAPIPGIVPLIQGLRQSGVKTALVSSTATHLIIMGLNRMQMTDLFDVIVCGDMCAERKPDPECYLKAMGLLGAVPQECLVFEDSSVGIHAAKQAGIEVAAFTGSGNGQDVSEADYVVSSYEESKRVLI